MIKFFRPINIIALLIIFLLFYQGYIELNAYYFFGIAIVSIFLVNLLPIIMKKKSKRKLPDHDGLERLSNRERMEFSNRILAERVSYDGYATEF